MNRLAPALALSLSTTLAGLAAAEGIPQPPALTDIGVDDRTGSTVPGDIELVDESGRAVRLGGYFRAGTPVLLVLVYSECAMLCNLVLRGLAAAVDELEVRPGMDYQLVTVSIDPEATPHTAARQQAALSAAARVAPKHWPFLTGDHAAIATLAEALGFRYARDPRTGQIAHPSVVFVLSPDRVITQYLHGVRYPPRDVERALERARTGTIEDAGPFEAALSCFRFDPTRRKYGPFVYGVLKVLAAALLISMGGCALWLRQRERRP